MYDYLKTQTQLFLFNPYRYEDEINKRTAAENEFVTLKKVRAVCKVPGACGHRFPAELGNLLTPLPWSCQIQALRAKKRSQVLCSLERSLKESVRLFSILNHPSGI